MVGAPTTATVTLASAIGVRVATTVGRRVPSGVAVPLRAGPSSSVGVAVTAVAVTRVGVDVGTSTPGISVGDGVTPGVRVAEAVATGFSSSVAVRVGVAVSLESDGASPLAIPGSLPFPGLLPFVSPEEGVSPFAVAGSTVGTAVTTCVSGVGASSPGAGVGVGVSSVSGRGVASGDGTPATATASVGVGASVTTIVSVGAELGKTFTLPSVLVTGKGSRSLQTIKAKSTKSIAPAVTIEGVKRKRSRSHSVQLSCERTATERGAFG